MYADFSLLYAGSFPDISGGFKWMKMPTQDMSVSVNSPFRAYYAYFSRIDSPPTVFSPFFNVILSFCRHLSNFQVNKSDIDFVMRLSFPISLRRTENIGIGGALTFPDDENSKMTKW